MAIAGRVAIVPKGDWSADATYKRLDAVTYNNTLYFAKKDVPAGTATSNTEYWSKSIVGGAGAIATTEDAGIVKPDGKSMSVDVSGTLSINLDGTTITLDEAKNVIKLADTLKDKINGAFPAANLINNLTTTEAGFGLDARQGKALDDKITELNGSLNGSNKLNLHAIADCIGINQTSVFRIINKLLLVQGYIYLKEAAKQAELLFKTNQLYGESSLILTSNVSGMSFPLVYDGSLEGMISPNRDIPGEQYYYVSGFLMEYKI